MEVILEFSEEWPESLTMWFTPSGASELIRLPPFEEAGEYWLRARVRDVMRYTWSDWIVYTINISEVELKKMFIIGSISEKNINGGYTFLTAKKILTFTLTPFDFRIISSSEGIIVISGNYSGFIGSSFVFGRFNADIIPN